MSEETRPNINAVGLMMAILASVEDYRRGPAGRVPRRELFLLLAERAGQFAEEVSDLLDETYGIN